MIPAYPAMNSELHYGQESRKKSKQKSS